jgi:hypothetical protein
MNREGVVGFYEKKKYAKRDRCKGDEIVYYAHIGFYALLRDEDIKEVKE